MWQLVHVLEHNYCRYTSCTGIIVLKKVLSPLYIFSSQLFIIYLSVPNNFLLFADFNTIKMVGLDGDDRSVYIVVQGNRYLSNFVGVVYTDGNVYYSEENRWFMSGHTFTPLQTWLIMFLNINYFGYIHYFVATGYCMPSWMAVNLVWFMRQMTTSLTALRSILLEQGCSGLTIVMGK